MHLLVSVLRRLPLLAGVASSLGFFCFTAGAMEPVSCPAGAPIGSFQLLVTDASGSAAPRTLQSVNELLPGYRIQYHPASIKGPDKKKARVTLVLVPSDEGNSKAKITVLDAKLADKDAEWSVPFQISIAALVYGPQGLDKTKVSSLIKKDDELVAQLADYAQKTQQTESIIQAITAQQQSLDTGQSVNAAVVSFANQYPDAPKLDRTQPVDAQMATLLHGLNPALSAYDPLAPNPSQRAAQSAGIAAAVAGLFFGTDVGLGASAGALLLNMHSLFFPRTEFRSAFAQTQPGGKNVTELCGNKAVSASRTELAFLWATRLPDASAPTLSLPATEHMALGENASVPLEVKAREWKLAARVQDWHLVPVDGKSSEPVSVRINAQNKSIELGLENAKLKPGPWKLAAMWDWTPVEVAGEIDLHHLSSFANARVAPSSQDRLIEGVGKVLVSLAGDDFEFVDKLSWKNCDDKFAQASTAPFLLPEGPHAGPQNTMETQIDTTSLLPGRYEFLIAQSDGTEHSVPFKVLPAPPRITNAPILVNTGEAAHIVLRGNGLDRLESLSADGAHIKLDAATSGDERGATVTLDPAEKKGAKLDFRVKVKDFDDPILLAGALVVAGPRPAIGNIRASLPSSAVTLAPGEIPAGSPVSFEFTVADGSDVAAVDLYCSAHSRKTLTIREGDGNSAGRLSREGPGILFLSFSPDNVGEPGCDLMVKAHSSDNGDSAPEKLGKIVLLPRIDTFQLSDRKAGDNTFYGEIRGQNLETIGKVGWDSNMGLAVGAIPAPLAGGGNEQTLQVQVPWPAPTPHSPLFIWLRYEDKGRATTVKW